MSVGRNLGKGMREGPLAADLGSRAQKHGGVKGRTFQTGLKPNLINIKGALGSRE